jgi:type II secretory pathway component PulC
MRSQLWVINSALIALFFVVMLILLVGQPTLVVRRRLESVPSVALVSSSASSLLDTSYIYEHDIFGTSASSAVQAPKPPVAPAVAPIPHPPAPAAHPAVDAQQGAPAFLPPLSIALKGIIYAPYEHDHRAIVEDKKTAQERLCKVGDIVLDAEIIRIESNKVMFLRSNGQQEIVYASSFEAQKDPLYQRAEGKYSALVPVHQVSPVEFLVDPHLFVLYVTNLAQFLDMLDVTTVFEKGRSIGCRIGLLPSPSLGILLGLQSGDIVATINGIPTGTSKERNAIYQQVSSMQEGTSIKVDVLRSEQRQLVQLTYKLVSFTQKHTTPAHQSALSQHLRRPGVSQTTAPVQKNNVPSMQRNLAVAGQNNVAMPVRKNTATDVNKSDTGKVAQTMRKNDKRAMVNYGRKPMAK